MKHHPAASIFPLMDGNDLNQLIEDIRLHGLLEPVVVYQGLILDGRNRVRACELAGVEYRFVEWQSKGETPMEFVLSKNLHRRHLTTAQKAVLALDLLPRLEEEAKARQQTHGGTAPGRPANTWGENVLSVQEAGKAVEKAAALVGVGPTAVKTARAIQKRNQDVADRMRTGEFTIARASREAGFEKMGNNDPPITEEGPSPHFGKGDKWREASEPLRRYLAAWEKRGFNFRHLNPREAEKRLATIDELMKWLTLARQELALRAERPRTTVD